MAIRHTIVQRTIDGFFNFYERRKKTNQKQKVILHFNEKIY
jgi:hypothetical protein